MDKKTTVLMILDGFGINERTEGNAIRQAKTPVLDSLKEKYPCVKGYASGRAVGLPDGQMGNSEVGHLNIGAGRIVYQELTRITKSIEDGDFFENPALMDAVEHCKKNNSALHLYGLLSDGGVHSHNTHLYALLQLAKRNGLEKVFVHVFLDGRDTPPASGADYTAQLEEKIREIGVGKIATVMGRFYVMDRDKRWERVQEAYNAMVLGKGETAQDAVGCIQKSYENGKTDEFVVPTVMVEEDGQAVGKISDHDAVIFYNFRPDRAREITRSLCDPDFDGFAREQVPQDLKYICFTEYDPTIPNKEVAFKPQRLDNTLGEYISSLGLKQLRTAETEKYSHVTFFFNGGVEEPNPNEDRWLVPSPKVATYDMKPEMSAVEVTDGLIKALESREYDLIIVNYPNNYLGNTVSVVKIKRFQDRFIAGDAFDELRGRKLTFRQLIRYPILMLDKNSTTNEFLHQLFQQHQLDLVPEIELTSNDLLIDLARIGLGIAFVPDYCISDNTEGIYVLDTKEELPQRELVLAYNEHLPLSRAAQEFLSYFKPEAQSAD